MSAADRQRRPTRHGVSLYFGTNDQDIEPFGRARDLSRTGLFVETKQRPPIGSMRELVLMWGRDTLTVPAKVVRHAEDGVGMCFVNPDAAFLAVIAEILETSPRVEVQSVKKV